MGKTIKMANRTNDNRHWSVVDMLEDATRAVVAGDIGKPNKAILIVLSPSSDDPDNIIPSYFKAGISNMFELVGILELAKADAELSFFMEGD